MCLVNIFEASFCSFKILYSEKPPSFTAYKRDGKSRKFLVLIAGHKMRFFVKLVESLKTQEIS